MNLNLLPDEMLVRVATYLNPETVIQIRKTSLRVNRILERNGFNILLPVPYCSIYGSHISNGATSLLFSFSLDKPLATAFGINAHHRIEANLANKTNIEFIHKLLSRIKVSDVFAMSSNGAFTSIGNEEIDVLLRNNTSLNRCKEICFFEVDFNCEEEKIAKFVRSMKKLDMLRLSEVTKTAHKIFNSNALAGRKWKSLTLNLNGMQTDKIQWPSNEFLFNVVRNCQKFSVPDESNCEVKFTVDGILTLLESMSFDSDDEYDWYLGIIPCPNGLEVKSAKNRINAIPGLEVNVEGRLQESDQGWKKYRHFTITSQFNHTLIKFTAYRV